MGRLQQAPIKYAPAQALKRIKKNLTNGKTYPTKHFRERLTERKISMQDANYVLKRGNITDEPELDIKTHHWKYKVRGKTVDNEQVSVVVALSDDSSILVTCMKG